MAPPDRPRDPRVRPRLFATSWTRATGLGAGCAALLALGLAWLPLHAASAQPAAPATAAPSPLPSGPVEPVLPPDAGPPGASPPPISAGAPSDSKFKTIFTNTLKYSTGLRTSPQNPAFLASKNTNDGDENFKQWDVTSSRWDLLSEVDIENAYAGVRFSGAGWFDSVYRGYNANDAPSTVNHTTPAFNQFPYGTQSISGLDSYLLDAFVFGNTNIAGMHNTVRFGRSAQEWGETLFFGNNGITGGMNPIDLTKQVAVPDAQFKEIILPVAQLDDDLQITPRLSVGFYYQFQWQPDISIPVGDYYSVSDTYQNGAQRDYIGGPISKGGPLESAYLGLPENPRNNDQFGAEVHWQVPVVDVDLGFYALQYNEHALATTVIDYGVGLKQQPGQIAQYYWQYAQGIQEYGASFSKSLGDIALAGEASWRDNTPLNSGGVTCGIKPAATASGHPVDLGSCGNNSTDPRYPIGTGVYADLNAIYTLPPLAFARESAFAMEVAWNDMLHADDPAALNPNGTREAAAMRWTFTPTYREIRPGVDLSVPIGMGMGLAGKTTALLPGYMQAGGVGDYELGLEADVRNVYTIQLRYTGYMGPSGPYLDPSNHLSLEQSDADRGNVSFSISRAF